MNSQRVFCSSHLIFHVRMYASERMDGGFQHMIRLLSSYPDLQSPLDKIPHPGTQSWGDIIPEPSPGAVMSCISTGAAEVQVYLNTAVMSVPGVSNCNYRNRKEEKHTVVVLGLSECILKARV